MDRQNVSQTLMDQVIQWRRHFHRNPELSYQEFNTSNYVFDTLKTFGSLEISRPTKTSVIARLIGAYPGKTLALRADMDALPIKEEANVPFSSNNPGVMHACGHDCHTAMLLGAAKVLTEYRHQLHGEIRFIFQHAEEMFPGGAKELVAAGAMEGVDQIIGLHVFTMIPAGKIGICTGHFTANSDTFDLTVIGKGGHSSQPQDTIDPIAIGSQIVTNLQHIIARNINPKDQAVVGVTEFQAGTAKNIVPDTITIGGSIRSFSQEVRLQASRLIEQIISGLTIAHNATYEYEYTFGYSSVFNDAVLTQKIEEIIMDEFGPDYLLHVDPFMGGEDFSAYLQEVPGCFIGIGAAHSDESLNFPHHHPRFSIDETSLEIGVNLLIAASLKLLAEPVKMA
ncbi:amidohydrolase [Bacillus sp. 1P06AnD]|uniref:amidohydrolase n=1 Tax=Bacillus sp. 1P06AnD TaxID=3132208 RepID=UPI0039A39DA4